MGHMKYSTMVVENCILKVCRWSSIVSDRQDDTWLVGSIRLGSRGR
jgi:hypothetical protein